MSSYDENKKVQDHKHEFEFYDFNGSESIFRCTFIADNGRCESIKYEPEDSGTGA